MRQGWFSRPPSEYFFIESGQEINRFTGGINVTDEENERLRADAYRDLHIRIEGHVVRSLQLVFVEDWLYATGQGRDVGMRRVHWRL